MGHNHGHTHGHGGTARAASITLVVNIALTCLKWTAFAVTGSPSLFGEAMHSSADTANPILLWFGYRRSTRPAHDHHPLGHGREAFFWSLLAAMMMLVIGSVMTALHGIRSLKTGDSPEISWVALCIMLLALLGEGYSLLYSVRGLRLGMDGKGGGSSKNTVLLALIVENAADMAGVVLALSGYGLYLATGNPMWDGLFSLAIATLLAFTSIFLIRRNLSLITGETAPASMHHDIAQTIMTIDFVDSIANLVVVMAAPDRLSCRITVRIDRSRALSRWAATKDISLRPEDAVIWTLDDIPRMREEITSTIHASHKHITDITVTCR